MVALIKNEILLFCHFTDICVSIDDPLKNWVALKGLGPSALVVKFELNSLENLEDVTFPSWTNLKKLYSPSDVNSISHG